MTIRIGTNKTVVNGVRGREIISIKALSKKKLPAEYLSWDGAVYREVSSDGKGACLQALEKASGSVGHSDIMVPSVFLKTGWWLSEQKFQAIRAGLIRAGNHLTEINKRQLKEWHGKDVVVVSALGIVNPDAIKGFDEIERLIHTHSNNGCWGELVLHKLQELTQPDGGVRVWLLTSKVKRNQKRYRVLNDTAVVECGGIISVESCQAVSRLLMKIILSIGLPDYTVTEPQFQKVMARLKRVIRNVESMSWQGMELVTI